MPLTDPKIRSLKPEEKDKKHADFGGLYLLVRTTGTKSWRMKFRFGGKEKLLVIGEYPAVTLAMARTKRDEAKAQLAAGIDPSAAKQEAKKVEREQTIETFTYFADLFLSKSNAEGHSPATMTMATWLLDMAKADFGDEPIRSITAPKVLETLRKLEAKGNFETAKRLRAKIGAVFRYAVASGAADTDPTWALKDALIKPKSKPRAAILSEDGLGNLLAAIDGYDGQMTTRIALRLLVLMAPRPGELRHARWAEIDSKEAVWSVPAERMKMRRPHFVPLAPQVLAQLEVLRAITGHTALLFPAIHTTLRPMSENTLNTAMRRMGFSAEEATAHGCRATFSTLANESGLWHKDAIERALAHVDEDATRRAYARGEYWEERVKLMTWWADKVEALGQRHGG